MSTPPPMQPPAMPGMPGMRPFVAPAPAPRREYPLVGRLSLVASLVGIVLSLTWILGLFVLPILLGRAPWLAEGSPFPVFAVMAFPASALFYVCGGIGGIVAIAARHGRRSGIAALVVAVIPALIGMVGFVVSMVGTIALWQSL